MGKSLNLWNLLFLGISWTIGSGSYALPGYTSNIAGPAVPICYLLIGIFTFCTALPYAEFGTIFHTSGYAYSYAQCSFG